MEINVNGSDDLNYRYKMESVRVTNGGFGNGLYTIISNLDSISHSLNIPPEILEKYITISLGSSFNDKKKSFTGTHDNKKIQKIIYNYINTFLICPNCSIPELVYEITKISNKKYDINYKCSACCDKKGIKIKNNIDEKCLENIKKYIIKEGFWKSTLLEK
jgi:translation initiation factor 5